MTKCVICNQRPANGGGFCATCGNKIEAERKARKPVKPKHYLVYKDNVVGLFPNGNGKLTARLLRVAVKGLPKYKTINLNQYCEGFTREAIKRFKRTVLQLANGK